MGARIDIATAADEAYIPHLAAMLYSLFRVCKSANVCVHFLHHADFDDKALVRLSALCRSHGANLVDTAVPANAIPRELLTARYRQEAWYRLRLPSLLPALDRVLWLDADMLVFADVSWLWKFDLEEKPLAAVPNALSPRDRRFAVEVLGMCDYRHYFNTGVMLLDLARMRKTEIERQLIDRAIRSCSTNRYADQDVFNLTFEHSYAPIPLAWNVTAGNYIYASESIKIHGSERYGEALQAPRIVHFTQHKPWLENSMHPYREEYWRNRGASGWGDRPSFKLSFARRVARILPISLYHFIRHPSRMSFTNLLVVFRCWLTSPHWGPQHLSPRREEHS